MRRFIPATIAVLFNVGLQVSGYQNVPLAILLWCIAGALGIWAVTTSEPIVSLREHLRLSALLARPPRELGFLEYTMIAHQAPAESARLFGVITRDVNALGKLATQYAPQFSAEWASGRPDATTRVRDLARRSARQMNRHFDHMEQVVGRLETLTARIMQAYNGMVDYARGRSGGAEEGLTSFRNAIAGMRDTAGVARAQTDGFRQTLVGLRGTSADINVMSDRGVEIMTRLIVILEQTQSGCQTVMAKVDEILAGNRPTPETPIP